MKKLASSLLMLTLAACSVLEPKPDRTRNYLLGEQASGVAGDRGDIALAIAPIGFPGYLDRAEMVTRESANKLTYSTLDRWAEPLSDNFARVFAADLGEAVGTENVVRFPTLSKTEVDFRVRVEVEQFERRDDGFAVLVARWELSRGASGATLRRARSVHEVAIDGAQTADAVDALSRATALFAEEVAAAIREADSGS